MNHRRSPPAEIEFALVDKASNPADVEVVCFRAGSAQPVSLFKLPKLSASRTGVTHKQPWDFAKTFDDCSLEQGLKLRVTAEGGSFVEVKDLCVGNDPPSLPEWNVSGLDPQTSTVRGSPVLVVFKVADSSQDPVSVHIEYQADGEGALAAATPVGGELAPGEAAFAGVVASVGGTPLVFAWDAIRDLGQTGREVRLRFVLDDGVDSAEFERPEGGGSFHVDNDPGAIALFDLSRMLVNPDARRGIPIAFRVLDEEGSRVHLVLQWRLASEASFPDLPKERQDLEAILANSDLRREKRIATEAPIAAEGIVALVDPALDPGGT